MLGLFPHEQWTEPVAVGDTYLHCDGFMVTKWVDWRSPSVFQMRSHQWVAIFWCSTDHLFGKLMSSWCSNQYWKHLPPRQGVPPVLLYSEIPDIAKEQPVSCGLDCRGKKSNYAQQDSCEFFPSKTGISPLQGTNPAERTNFRLQKHTRSRGKFRSLSAWRDWIIPGAK